MTPFYPPPLPVPDVLQTAEFHLEPLTPAHVALDYAALMAGKEALRQWSGSPWPQDDFTLEDNRVDLQWHWDEHQARIAFTYTVLDPAQTVCLGCVYIKPLGDLVRLNADVLDDVSARDGLVRFWVTQPYRVDGRDGRLLTTLIDWFANAWQFERVYFHTPKAYEAQMKLYGRFLSHVADVLMPQRGGAHALFAAFPE